MQSVVLLDEMVNLLISCTLTSTNETSPRSVHFKKTNRRIYRKYKDGIREFKYVKPAFGHGLCRRCQRALEKRG